MGYWSCCLLLFYVQICINTKNIRKYIKKCFPFFINFVILTATVDFEHDSQKQQSETVSQPAHTTLKAFYEWTVGRWNEKDIPQKLLKHPSFASDIIELELLTGTKLELN